MSVKPAKHGRDHTIGGEDPIPNPPQFDIKVFGDTQLTSVGDGKFIFAIPADLNGTQLITAEAYLTTADFDDPTEIQIRNVTDDDDLLSTKITIDDSFLTSYESGPPAVIIPGQPVATGDLIAIDVDAAGAAGQGLGVILEFDLVA